MNIDTMTTEDIANAIAAKLMLYIDEPFRHRIDSINTADSTLSITLYNTYGNTAIIKYRFEKLKNMCQTDGFDKTVITVAKQTENVICAHEKRALSEKMSENRKYLNNEENTSDENSSSVLDRIKDSIRFTMINYESSKDTAKHIIHRDFLDLMKCLCVIEKDCGKAKINLLPKEIPELIKVPEETLFAWAEENTKNDGIQLMSMADGLTIVTTPETYNGAVMLTMKDAMQTIAAKINDDLYIIPSSRHELICMPQTLPDAYTVRNDYVQYIMSTIKCVNGMDVVNETEFLSNRLYAYSRENDSIDCMPINTKEAASLLDEEYEHIICCGQHALFTNARIKDRENLPGSAYAYDLEETADADENTLPFAALREHVTVNHGGTVIVKKRILKEKTFVKGTPSEDDSPNFLGDEMTLRDFMNTSEEQLENTES